MTLQVVWSNPFGDIFLDADIKLFEFEDIQKYSGYNDPPKSKEFCRFYTSSSSKVKSQKQTILLWKFNFSQELDGFDSSIFWTAGLLWKFFSTCGVETWDRDFGELVVEKIRSNILSKNISFNLLPNILLNLLPKIPYPTKYAIQTSHPIIFNWIPTSCRPVDQKIHYNILPNIPFKQC